MEFLKIIENNRQRFLEFNEKKIQRFQQLFYNVNTRKVINSIPFLLSVNHKKLPGYIDENTPYGIVNYKADEETKRFIRSKFPTVKIEIEQENPFIEMLAVMGSVGTIAYNKRSDFDYWVCVNRSSIPKEMFEKFTKKVEAIQNWAMSEIDASVHLFINDIELIKQNIFAEDTDEAFGSTVGAVLKDEFFRSSIIICGKIPFWWVLPQFVRDDEYNNLYQRLSPEKKRTEYVDLGNLFEISIEDFLGAALFQIIKSLGNPFKSIIKIGVLEKYIFGSDDSPLLSQKVKINIQRGNIDNTILDSYLLMFEEVYNYYYSTIEDKNMLNILKQNLYLKIDPHLSKYIGVKEKKNIPYKVEIMFKYAQEWGWNIQDIKNLDNFDNWDFNKVMKFWDLVKKFMLMSYQRISVHLPTLNLEKKISETDFMLLSRKIKTHFAVERDKIEKFITFKDTPSESILYIEPASKGLNSVEWRLYKRNTSKKDTFISTTIKVDNNLLKLLIWTVLNKIYDPVFTRFNIQSEYSRINQKRIVELLDQMSSFFTDDNIYLKNEYFFNSSFNLLNLLIINFGNEDDETISTIHHLYHTSWGESFFKEYNSEDVLSKILFMILRDGYKLKRCYDNFCLINTPEPYKKQYKRIIYMFKEAYRFVVEDDSNESVRFVSFIGNQFVINTKDGDNIEKDVFPNIISLLAGITLKPKKEMNYLFFGDEGPLKLLNKIYSLAQKDSISIIYEEKGSFIFAYVINENGNLFSFFCPIVKKDVFLVYLYDFCLNIIKRIKATCILSKKITGGICLKCIKSDRFGKLSITDESQLIRKKHSIQFNSIGALVASVSKHKEKETLYNIIFPDKTSSGFIAYSRMVSIAHILIELRDNGIASNIIRDLVFNDLTDEEIESGSSLYFLEKYKLEFVLEKAIKTK